jgi:NADPH:quinone reductase-like Zn-dependent oxidoreductase
MRAALLTSSAPHGSVASVVRVVADHPEPPPPGAGEARLRTLASALNQMDLWVAIGIPGLDLTYPRVSGCDACAVVESVGEGVDPAWVGKRVVFNAAVRQPERVHPDDPTDAQLAPEYELIGEHHDGAHRALFNAPAANLAAVADHVSDEDAAAFGLTALTAMGMVKKAGILPGQRVLVTGIGGGVATAALSICKWLGCPVAVTSRHQWKLDKAKELGADFAVLDEGQEWSRDIRRWTNKRGVESVLDSIGDAVHLDCIASLARGGAFVTCGATSGAITKTHLGRIFWGQLRLLGSTMGSNNDFREVVSLLNAGKIGPVVDSTHPWEKAGEAWGRLESGEQFGKVVIRWG